MAMIDNSYSRLIAWLRIILPLAALAILSTLFFVSSPVDPTLSIPIADDEIQELANQPRIGKPALSGVSENGTAFSLAADVGQPLPDGQTGLTIQGISASLETPDGQTVEIFAALGTVNTTEQSADLTGGVTLATSLGYLVETDAILADFKGSTIKTTGQVMGTGPLGHVTAGRMLLQSNSTDNADSFELIFQDGVILVYDPNKYQE